MRSTVVLTTGLVLAASVPGAEAAEIELAPESYRVRYNSMAGLWAFEESPIGTLNVSVLDISIAEYYRPVIQFDLGSITEPIQSASINLYLENKSSNTQFDVHLYGSSDNRPAAVAAADSGAADEFFDTSYLLLHDADDAFVDRSEEDERWYSLDVTEFVSARYAEYEAGGDSFVFFRLQPETTYNGTSGIDDVYSFAAYGYGESTRPYLNVQVVPEPASLALLGAGGMLLVRRRGR